ncbi:MAG: flavodoxin [Bacteroidales bacterium]|nr:flavodoxin [Bacteroidales bacterium]
MKKIGLIYSFNTNKTSQAAKKIAKEIGDQNISHVNAENITEKEFLKFDLIMLGVPTWFDGELPNYWDEFVPALEDMDLKGKTCAVFGNGDQKGYPENFVDGIGIMADLLESRGAKLAGFTSVEGYQFEGSKAVRGDQFTGLALDFENQGKEINSRIKNWVKQLRQELGI